MLIVNGEVFMQPYLFSSQQNCLHNVSLTLPASNGIHYIHRGMKMNEGRHSITENCPDVSIQ